MLVARTVKELQDRLKQHRQSGQSIALVPTMGNLHQGHLQLVKTAKKYADVVLVTLFVNPTQFAENEDLDSYPRTFQDDCDKLEALDAPGRSPRRSESGRPLFWRHPTPGCPRA